MITKEEILRLACAMSAEECRDFGQLVSDVRTKNMQACFNAIVELCHRENIRIEDGPARRDSIYTPEVEAALAEKKRRTEADNEKPWTPF